MSRLRPSRRSAIAPFMAMDALRDARALERAGRHIIHMELGEPGAPSPRRVRAAAEAALRTGGLGYGEAMGDLRCASESPRITRSATASGLAPPHYRHDRLIGRLRAGASRRLRPGARIAVTAPGYPAYANILSSLGIEPVALDVDHRPALRRPPICSRPPMAKRASTAPCS